MDVVSWKSEFFSVALGGVVPPTAPWTPTDGGERGMAEPAKKIWLPTLILFSTSQINQKMWHYKNQAKKWNAVP